MGQQSVIAYNRRNESEPDGFNKHFAPTYVREPTSRYDSFDTKYETLKFTQSKEYKDCPLLNEGVCQKIWKITKGLIRSIASKSISIQSLWFTNASKLVADWINAQWNTQNIA